MLTVTAAYEIVLRTVRESGTETVPFEYSSGRILRQPILADRPFPPFDRVMMDGIAINFDSYARGQHIFGVEDVQAAGQPRLQLSNTANCIEVMTGAVLPELTDTVIPYEHLTLSEHEGFKRFTVHTAAKKGQHIHEEGKDVKQGAILLAPGTLIGPAEIGVLATVGQTTVEVSRKPRVVILATGDELVQVHETPAPHQIRISNAYSLLAALKAMDIDAEFIHLTDDEDIMSATLTSLLSDTDIWISSGAVSAGKYDFLPAILQQLGMKQLFHKVQQRPGKPFLFGEFENGPVVFALPGNPVSSFMCFYRYVRPYILAAMRGQVSQPIYAELSEKVVFEANLEYFLPVKLEVNTSGVVLAHPQPYQGSGDLASLLNADGFLVLPAADSYFEKGKSFQVWKFR
ncbi:molybdopterin molybdenumtransferase MoeA [Chitinophaga silvatica]|uniref:Molybdopterin molybdenumtransferase n=1 Tax=Chitinophaga silvatica TaxID=2282649 RepID=A0A3E1YA86_9BACT|nr:molybdopterin molybdotransferase MoeA [Chitinophaga silvatica]RFS22620.1 molybdopterin molybdenumtransferase MoeA [Chitinophaga silvatica]